ncbi:uncharacterized protein LOC111706324 [Eurytemora carolleeae]|uniref:uncharacterized protein LOC111706324 n=1 Tax=Eurytemora carolleeae TaxID=1294199 RepID=UPI000C78C759|nr:uncharacterized protein LOC111706324 [Eurytemora carolleeae]|eukprot:XP_023334940.1 uncharacterized protein LOC111706324 [Eurytemora affinis]
MIQELTPKTKLIPLDPKRPMRQINEYLDSLRIGHEVNKDEHENTKCDLSQPSGAKKSHMRSLSCEDAEKEIIYNNLMMTRVYEMMRENKDKFGEVSLEDVREQMAMYKLN